MTSRKNFACLFTAAISLFAAVVKSHAAIPVITQQPQSQTNIVGSNAVFRVEASGSILGYQWLRFNFPLTNGVTPLGETVAGADTSILVISNLARTGLFPTPYSVVVSNADGAVTSSNAESFVFNFIEARILAFQPGDPPIILPPGAFFEPVLIDKNVDIQGSGPGITVVHSGRDAGASPPVFRILTNVTARVANLTIDGDQQIRFGFQGGGIWNQGALKLETVMVTNSGAFYGGGIYNEGNLEATNVVVCNNRATFDGGGIVNVGALTMTNSLISSNQATERVEGFAVGPGIENSGFCVLDATTVNENTGLFSGGVNVLGGGVFNSGRMIINRCAILNNAANNGGAGIDSSGELQVTNTTVSGNRGVGVSAGSATLESCTIVSNLFAGLRGNAAQIRNTILFGNSPDCAGSIVSLGYNLIGATNGSALAGTSQGNIIGQDPLLGPLQDNGGPTLTHALPADSPAINAASPTDFPPVDQRGFPRPVDGTGFSALLPDIGAFEKQPGPVPVTTLADSGRGSLRQALATSAPGSKIILDVNGTIFLTSGPLVIDKNTEIAGPCAQLLTIDPQHSSVAFVISNDAKVTISDLTISNALNSALPPEGHGGAIRNFGDLTLIRTWVVNNSTEGIGGGIYNNGTLALRQCAVSKNSAAFGGGIGDDGFGRLTMESSTISANTAALPEGTSGGGIFKLHNIALLTDSTISGNRTAPGNGGGIAAFCYFKFENCTIVSNNVFALEMPFLGKGGGLFIGVGGSAETRNTIFAQNKAFFILTGTTNASDCFGALFSQGYNLIQSTADSAIAGVLTGNLTGLDPVLGPLQDNGGPTQTHALLPGSPAIDAGSPYDFPPADQRGISRPQDGNGDGTPIADIGAYEKETIIPGGIPGTIIVTSLEDSGPGTLRDALNTAPDGAKITFGVEGTIRVLSDSLLVSRNVQIAGPGVDKLALTGFSPVFLVSNTATATLSDVRITNAFRSEFNPGGIGGGAVRNFGNFTMTRCVASDCGSEFGAGGAILSFGSLALHQCSISNNATESGGGIADAGNGRLIVDRCTINNNRSIHGGNFEGAGGGIVKSSGLMWMSNSTVSGNSAFAGDGGGLAIGSAYVFIDSCSIVSNSASSPFIGDFGRGGGLFEFGSGTVEIRNTILAGNSAFREAIPEPVSLGPDCFGQLFSQGWNLIQNPSDCIIAGVLTGNIIGASPCLGPLADNGGPTLTHALLTNSPAVDAGSPWTFQPIDQRGISRPQDGNGDGVAISDIGAFEKETPLPACVAKIESISIQGDDNVAVIASGAPGELYTIQSTETLISPKWVTLPAIATAPSGLFQFTDTRPRASQTRYYRTLKISDP